MAELPTGTVTFLFTDIEGSTRLLTEAGPEYASLLEEHRRLIGGAVERHAGVVFGTEGDALFAAFTSAAGALAAAADAQRAVLDHPWPEARSVRVRMGVHSGEVTLTGGDYVGLATHEVARITAAGHGGQVLVSGVTRGLSGDGLELRDLGEHRLKDLSNPARLYQLVAEGLPDQFPPLRTLGQRPHNLPVQLTSFIGREELKQGMRLLGGTRLLTLTGPGGTGKTRLALQLAAEASDDFGDGAFFVPLDALRDPEVVPSAIITALGLPAAASNAAPPLTRVLGYLRERSVLLVLDNFEQIIDGAALVAQLLREAPGVKVLATSRIPLRISGEQEFPIPPLGLPQDKRITAEQGLRSEAVLLFVERGAAARPDFRLDDQNATSVVEIVRRLDGLPLAIELAAARLRVLSVDALHDRLDHSLAVLAHGPRDLPERHQTLRGTIEWSYELLEVPDRDLFERFGVFAGAACLVEAESVCGPPDELGEEVLDGLISLSEKSLVRTVPGALEEPRFAMLATIREYATDRLADRPETEGLRRRHAETYLELVEGVAPHVFGADGRRLLDRLEQDHDNLRLALDWAIEKQDAAIALRFAAGAWRFWQIRGHIQEGWERMQRVLALPGVVDQPPGLRARALGAAGGLAYWRSDLGSAHALYREALELARGSGEPALVAEALNNFGFAPFADASKLPSEQLVAGRPFFEEAIGIYRQLQDRDGLASATWSLAGSYVDAGENEAARPLIEESLALYRDAGSRFGEGWALSLLANLEYRERNLEASLDHMLKALRLFADTGDTSGIALCLVALAIGARDIGAREQYLRLGGAAIALAERLGFRLDQSDSLDRLGLQSPVRPNDDDPDAQRLWDEGAAMPIEEMVRYALELATLDVGALSARTAVDPKA